ncbi:hypothetical protein CMV_027697 [Castanea mollissima]|uniref:Reverse transcriptase/retrotransposon-derived protein RNase H-like domain-containing protein n=1 Tax=Castanea mollissima TaxID=60419 RepID=A0A8J4Q9F1_9ROSI|nr:hypothetical protein CMV_027697 [Castanea mollissima]
MDFLPPFLNSATIAGILAIILFSYYLLKRSRVGLAKTAPIPAGAWPVIGHLPLLGATQTPHITLGAMADKYGPLFTVKLGLHPTLVLSSWRWLRSAVYTEAIRQLKKLAEKLLPLQISGTDKRVLQTDASDEYWAAALFEEIDSKRNICGYKSGAFKPSELHYHSTFKEIIAVKHGIEKFQFHLKVFHLLEML